MKYCARCGAENYDVNEVCTRCKAPFAARPSVLRTENSSDSFTPENTYYSQGHSNYAFKDQRESESHLSIVAKVFMVISTCTAGAGMLMAFVFWFILMAVEAPNDMILFCYIYMVFALATFITALFMTNHYFSVTNSGNDVGMSFKICTLIFVSSVSGILMLCDNREH